MVLALGHNTIRIYYAFEINRDISVVMKRQDKEKLEMANNTENKTNLDKQDMRPRADNVSQMRTENTGERSEGAWASGGAGTAAATARSFYDQAKETAGQAYEAVTETAATKLDKRRSTLSGGLATVADSVRQVGDNLDSSSSKTDSGLANTAAKYTHTAARKIDNVATYFDSKSVREMASDLEAFARRNPAIFLGAAFGLGVLAARFLKSTPPRFEQRSGGSFTDGADGASRDRAAKAGFESGSSSPKQAASSIDPVPNRPNPM
jgi:hypothetical protein